MSLGIKILEMEFHKPKFSKNNYRSTRDDRSSGYRGPRDDRSSGYRGPRDDRSSGYNRDSRSGGSRFNRNDNGSRFNRGSEDNQSRETYKATCGDCGNECQIPFKPKYDRPVYCKKCFQDHKPQERSGDSRFNRGPSYGRNDRSSGYRGPRDDRSSSYSGPRNYRSSGYNQGQSRFQKDRTPIYSRDNFGTTKYPSKNEESYKKNSRDYNPNNFNSFYSTLRTKLFTVLGEKKCVNCGFEDERALGFGHTDDMASFDYIQRAGTASSWEKYISDPDLAKKELQVLCLNCNMIKQKE